MYKHKLPGVVRFFLALISIALCFVLFATSLLTIVVADLHVVTSENGLQTIIMQILMPSKAPAARPGLAAGRPVISHSEAGTSGTNDMIVDAIMDMLKQQFGSDLPITEAEIRAILEETTLPEFISEKVAGLVSDIFNGETPTLDITVEEVEGLLRDNAPVINKYLGAYGDVEITEELIHQVGTVLEEQKVLEQVEQVLQENLGFGNTSTPTDKPDDENAQTPTQAPGSSGDNESVIPGGNSGSTNQPTWSGSTSTGVFGSAVIGAVESFVGITPAQKELVADIIAGKDPAPTAIPVAISLLRAISSTNALLLCIGMCLLVFLLMLLTHWGRPFAAVRTAGIPVMLAGTLMLLVGLAAGTLLPGMMGNDVQTVMGILLPVLTMFNYVSGGVAVGGLVLIILGATLNGVFARRAERMAAEAVKSAVSVPVNAPVDTFSELLLEEEPEAPAAEEAPEAEAEEKAE